MKKILKYILLSIVILIAVCALLHQIFFAKTFEFVLAARDKDIPHMEQMIKDGYDPVADRYFGDGILTLYLNKCIDGRMAFDIRTVAYLLDKGVSTNVTANGKSSALQLAIKYNQFQLTKLLIEHGADINYENEGSTAFDNIIRFQQFELIHLIPLEEAKIGKNVGNNLDLLKNLLFHNMWDIRYSKVIQLFINQGYYSREDVENLYEEMQTKTINYFAENNIESGKFGKLNELHLKE